MSQEQENNSDYIKEHEELVEIFKLFASKISAAMKSKTDLYADTRAL